MDADDQSDICFPIAQGTWVYAYQFWGESAKSGIPIFIHWTDISQRLEDRNADGRVNTNYDPAASVEIW